MRQTKDRACFRRQQRDNALRRIHMELPEMSASAVRGSVKRVKKGKRGRPKKAA